MNSTTPALIAAAAGVGFGHAIMPDHWVPLAVVGRTRRYPIARVARLSGLAGLAHVLVSLMLGALIVAVGLQFRALVEHTQNVVVGSLLLLTGIGFVVFELRGHGHHHDHDHHAHRAGSAHAHEHAQEHRRPTDQRSRLSAVTAIMIPFGAAASPDLTILPVFLAATTAGAATAVGSLIVFAAITIATMMFLTLAAAFGSYRIRARWLERWANAITAAILIVIGLLVLLGAI